MCIGCLVCPFCAAGAALGLVAGPRGRGGGGGRKGQERVRELSQVVAHRCSVRTYRVARSSAARDSKLLPISREKVEALILGPARHLYLFAVLPATLVSRIIGRLGLSGPRVRSRNGRCSGECRNFLRPLKAAAVAVAALLLAVIWKLKLKVRSAGLGSTLGY
jgi:hypothetical protein